MLSAPRSATKFVLLVLSSNLVAAAGDRPNPRAKLSPETFSRAQLLRWFDKNTDGSFNRAERTAMRDSFGGIDIPVLPTKSYAYNTPPRPVRIEPSVLASLDNSASTNPLSDAGAALGRVLFYDTQLSKNNTIACASCHHQEHGFAEPRQFSLGFEGRYTMRNSMGLANLRYSILRGSSAGFFWDERAPTLEAQVLMPIQDPIEMGMELPALKTKLQALPYYPGLFQAAFGSAEVTSARIAKAVAQFMRAMTSFDSRFDRAATTSNTYTHDFEEFSEQENLGKSLFIDGVGGIAEIGCAHCHIPPTFGMPKSFNNGLDVYYIDRGLGNRDVPSNDPFTPSNDGKFKAPSLRNVALTAPYMHDGRFKTLEEVVEHYSSRVRPHPNLGLAFNSEEQPSGKTSGFRLDANQKSAVVAFLKTLTDEKFISDPRFSDPFVRLHN